MMVEDGSTLELNVKTTGADTETPVAPFGGSLVGAPCAKAAGKPANKRNVEANIAMVNVGTEGLCRLRFIQFP
jgi:hypothetical protein